MSQRLPRYSAAVLLSAESQSGRRTSVAVTGGRIHRLPRPRVLLLALIHPQSLAQLGESDLVVESLVTPQPQSYGREGVDWVRAHQVAISALISHSYTVRLGGCGPVRA